MPFWNQLLAQTSGSGLSAANSGAAAGKVQSTFEFGRLVNFAAWEWLLLIAAIVAVISVVIYFYLRDTIEIGRGKAIFFIMLRVIVYGGLLWVFLQPQNRRTHEEVVKSKVIVLIDTSLSMAKKDELATNRRIDEVIEKLKSGQLIPELQKTHQVAVYRFDTDLGLIREFDKIDPKAEQPANTDSNAKSADEETTDGSSEQDPAAGGTPADDTDPESASQPVKWETALEPRGRETRLGQSLRQILSDERAAPISGIVVITDGRNNSGIEVESAIELAQDLRFPVHTIGLGSALPPLSAQLSDFVVPARAFPGDAYTANAFVTGSGLKGRQASIEILKRLAGADESTEEVVNAQEFTFGEDGEVISVPFEMKSEEPGKFILKARMLINEPRLDKSEIAKLKSEKLIDIVDRQTKVLLFAGGPTRDYHFVRNQLHRDASMIVDVLLQNAREGISQDAHDILDEFPINKTELYEYDAIIAFDPDWRELTEGQIDMLRDWVGKEAGGLVVVPGPVFTDLWAQLESERGAASSKYGKVRALYPVAFREHLNLIQAGEFDNTEAWPLEFSTEGLSADFLWLEDTAVASEAAWSSFEGVFGYYNVGGSKPGATVYARFSNPSTNSGSGLPVYMAGQFYGAGRVFYMGSGETWRLRSLDVGYFEALWTKLVRHVSQGRLLRGSQRAVLLVERDKYQLGDSVAVRAQMKDTQLEPMTIPTVELEVITPSADRVPVTLTKSDSEPGMYDAQFPVYQEGTFRLRLESPDSAEDVAERTIEVKLPQLESENTQRNDALLEEIAKKTGGQSYINLDPAIKPDEGVSIFAALPNAERTLILADRPQSLWDNQWTLLAIVGVLCIEWLVRRLSKLA